jgi:peptide/nickel transport system ATP-binding protein
MAELLNIADLRIRFGDYQAVRGVSFSIAEGETFGLVGESGCGKSATSLALMGLLGPSAAAAGSIRFGGRELIGLPANQMRALRGREIAMIFQEPMTALNPVMRVGQQLAEALEAHQPTLTSRERQIRVIAAMEAVGLPEPEMRWRDYPHQFSGGQRQRLIIAMAVMNRPRLLIADEPTTALDVTVQAQILALLRDLREQYGMAMLFISHDLGVVAQMADRVGVMRGGLLLESGSREAIFRNPGHAYTRNLLGAVPSMTTPRHQPLAMVPPIDGELAGELVEVTKGHWIREILPTGHATE